MSKNVVVNGTTYNGVDSVKLPLSGGGYATFADAESGTSQTVELFSKTISEAANNIPITWSSSWNGYVAYIIEFTNVTLSATDYLRVGYDTLELNGAGFYPNANAKFTTLASKVCLLFSKYNGALYRVAENISNEIISATPSVINCFATTRSTNVTGGTIKIYGVK